MEVGVVVEERRWKEILPAGALAGLLAGLALALAQLLVSLVQGDSLLEPFRLVATLVLGTQALVAGTPAVLVVALGAFVHLALAVLFGLVFVWLLTLLFQLSARRSLLLLYGALFGFLLWEVNFLAALPLFFPELAPRFGVSGQLWRGIIAYALVYGPVLGLVIAAIRPGVRASWRSRD